MDIDRMDLRKIVDWCYKNSFRNTARYFEGFRNDRQVTVDQWWIDKAFVTRHVGEDIMTRMQNDGLTVRTRPYIHKNI